MSDDFRLPTGPPGAADLASRDRWTELADTSLERTRAAAEKWRTGLAGMVTVITTGLLFKGPEAAKDISTSWRAVLSLLVGGGLTALLLGLWLALRAAAGTPAEHDYFEVMRDHGSVREFELVSARTAASSLASARRCVAAALVLLGAGIIVWWWVPTVTTQYLRVQREEDSVCGTLESGDEHTLVIRVEGKRHATKIAYDDVANLFIVSSCD